MITTSAIDTLINMGSPAISFGYRSSLAIATVKGDNNAYCTVASAYNVQGQGPTRIDISMDMFLDSGCL